MFTDIKVIIWDFDGTLYKMKPELSNALRQAELDTIALHKKWPKEKILAEFEKLHKTLPSATATVAQISGISTSQAAFESESLFDRRDYLEKDDKIVSLFQSLPTVMHVLLTNGYSTFIKEAIIKLGLRLDTFSEIVTSEKVGQNKPSLVGFEYILHSYSCSPKHYLSVGDRPLVDLVPAKSLGMHTCLVWSSMPHEAAEVVLETVYEVPKNLTF